MRRSVLKALGAAGAAGALGGLAGAQEGTTRTTAVADGGSPRILLGAQVEYWFGIAPGAIQGGENPTLAYRPGEQLEVTWINIDGEKHQLQFLDADGNVVTETGEGEGDVSVVSTSFTAPEGIVAYRCRYHPNSMRGEVREGSFETETVEETTTG